MPLPPGGTLGVVGESGSGKSTLALAALGLIPHLAASWRWSAGAGARTPRATRRIRRLVQVVFQDPFSSLSPRMTVEEIVGEGLLVHEPGLPVEQRARARDRRRWTTSAWPKRSSPACCSAIRTSFPAASASGSRSRGR